MASPAFVTRPPMTISTHSSTRTRITPRCTIPSRQSRQRLNELRAQLSAAVRMQDFALAAQLRDQIVVTESAASDDLAVALANDAFYDAFRRADTEAMAAVWLSADSVSCAHVASGMAVGFDDVIASWRATFVDVRASSVDVEEIAITVRRNVAWVICRQVVATVRGKDTVGGERMATNIFQKRRGRWLMVHHHASPVGLPGEDDDRPQPPSNPPSTGT